MKRIMVLWITFWSGTVYAGAFQDAQNFAAGHPASNLVQGATVTGSNVPGYTTSNPTQTTLNNPTSLSGSATGAIANDSTGAGSFIQNSSVSRPQFTINGNSPLVKGAQSIQANAGALSGITPSNTSGCQSVQVSSPAQYDTYTCTQSNTIVSPVCNQSLSVTAQTIPGIPAIPGIDGLSKTSWSCGGSCGKRGTYYTNITTGVSYTSDPRNFTASWQYTRYTGTGIPTVRHGNKVRASTIILVAAVPPVAAVPSVTTFTDTWSNLPCQ